MQMCCPHCAMRLLVANEADRVVFLCPFCGRSFQVPVPTCSKQLLVALDVSTSATAYLAAMQRETVELQNRKLTGTLAQMRLYTFHRQLLPFPCEHLCRPQSGESIILPTLRDLRGRVARGSAILDALYQLLTEAEAHSGVSCDVVLMTDGAERGSCRHPEEVRRRIQRIRGDTNIHILGFTQTSGHRAILGLIRLLATPRVMWSFHTTSSCCSAFFRSSSAGQLHLSYDRGSESCRI